MLARRPILKATASTERSGDDMTMLFEGAAAPKTARPDRPARPAKTEKLEKLDRVDKVAKPARADKADKADKVEKPEKAEKAARVAKSVENYTAPAATQYFNAKKAAKESS